MRAVIDHHVDRPDVDAQQCVKLTGTNRSIGLILLPIARSDKRTAQASGSAQPTTSFTHLILGRPGGHCEGQYTRSHPELGRENPQRQWYSVLRRGRVGHRQVFQEPQTQTHPITVRLRPQGYGATRNANLGRGVEQPIACDRVRLITVTRLS